MDPEVSSSDGAKGPFCPHCGRGVPSDAVFCPFCGRGMSAPGPVPPQYQYNPYQPYGNQYGYPYNSSYQPVSESENLRTAARWIASVVVFVLLLVVSFNVIVLVWGIGQVLPNVAGHSAYLFIITPWLVDILRISDAEISIYFLFLVVAIVASFVWMLKKSLHKFAHELTFQIHDEGHSPLYMISTLFFAVIAFNILFYIAIGFFGSSPSVPGQAADLWQILYSYAQASVWEEVITRVLLLGVPLLLIAIATNKVKDPKHYILGGGFQLGKTELTLLVFSSAMFGLAHSFNWDIYKVLPAFIAGMAMGYLFLKFGLYAAIMFHFFTDYLSMSLSIWPDNLGLELAIGLMMLVFIAVGVIYFIHYSFKAFELFTGIKLIRKRPVAAGPTYYPPQPYYNPYPQGYYDPYQNPPNMYQQYQQYPQTPQAPPYPQPTPPTGPDNGFGFICPHCGGTEARYSDGKFECLKCGRKI
jgi:hypothetical protein